MKNRSLASLTALFLTAASLVQPLPALTEGVSPAPGSVSQRHPMASRAEAGFFEALNRDPSRRDAALADLTLAYAIDPKDARTSLLLGMGHLWAAAEGGPQNPEGIPHLMLAERFLARAQALDPRDERIASWVEPARLSLGAIERDPSKAAESLARLRAAYEKRPAFHAFSLALVSAGAPAGSEREKQALEAIRASIRVCEDPADRACGNAPRWPRNREGYLLFAAEWEARAGSVAAARKHLDAMGATDASWAGYEAASHFRAALDRREKGEPGAFDGYVPLMDGKRRVSCQSCHLGAGR